MADNQVVLVHLSFGDDLSVNDVSDLAGGLIDSVEFIGIDAQTGEEVTVRLVPGVEAESDDDE